MKFTFDNKIFLILFANSLSVNFFLIRNQIAETAWLTEQVRALAQILDRVEKIEETSKTVVYNLVPAAPVAFFSENFLVGVIVASCVIIAFVFFTDSGTPGFVETANIINDTARETLHKWKQNEMLAVYIKRNKAAEMADRKAQILLEHYKFLLEIKKFLFLGPTDT